MNRFLTVVLVLVKRCTLLQQLLVNKILIMSSNDITTLYLWANRYGHCKIGLRVRVRDWITYNFPIEGLGANTI